MSTKHTPPRISASDCDLVEKIAQRAIVMYQRAGIKIPKLHIIFRHARAALKKARGE